MATGAGKRLGVPHCSRSCFSFPIPARERPSPRAFHGFRSK
ncbi:uncharacterized protein G2W53_004634 [Senna tora]|uniref:Uncharacterized protein n=1 Tax=Senna tora TaxID=362788 RepID=A0A835CGM3_9FABA|nr:uncharacterized protein G2W53_004634 [Senna tora]